MPAPVITKERNILCNPLTKELNNKDFRSPMLPIQALDTYSAITPMALLYLFDSWYSNLYINGKIYRNSNLF